MVGSIDVELPQPSLVENPEDQQESIQPNDESKIKIVLDD
jgi:hypothetical protein